MVSLNVILLHFVFSYYFVLYYLSNVRNDMFVVYVVIVMSSKAQDEKAVYDAACQGKIDVIKALSAKGTDLNRYKDSVSKPGTFSILILLETSQ